MKMKIRISICTLTGWKEFGLSVPSGADNRCYALSRTACRCEFWERESGVQLPRGHAVIWKTL